MDVATGGKVRKRIAEAKEKYREYKNRKTGHVNGKGDDGREKTFNPTDKTDVDEYLDNNNGAKSRVNYSESSSERPVNGSRDGSPGREPSGPKYPQSAAPTQSTQNIKKPETNADPITDSSNNNDKTIISQNEDIGKDKIIKKHIMLV